jgi:dsDNA-specific endonuclease/ATPase MutS2
LNRARDYCQSEPGRVESLVNLLQNQKNTLNQDISKYKKLQHELSENVLKLKSAYRTIKDIPANAKSSSRVSDVQKETSEILKNVETVWRVPEEEATVPTQQSLPEFWKVGMRVTSSHFPGVGVVTQAADQKGLVACEFFAGSGAMRVRVKYNALRSANSGDFKPKNSAPPPRTPAGKHPSAHTAHTTTDSPANFATAFTEENETQIPETLQHSGNTIDLRGMTVDEALNALDQGLVRISKTEDQGIIIHGHGSGRLKEAVRKALELEKESLIFRAGRYGEGGDGVTVVQFI